MLLKLLYSSRSDGKNKDLIRVKGDRMDLHLNIVQGMQGDYYICLAPSINVSGYGETEEEAQEFFDKEVELFCEDIMLLSTKERNAYLLELGFHSGPFNRKNYSKSYVDENGVLKGLEFEPGTLKRKVLQTA